MLDLRTGKEMTRRETIKGGLGLAAILAAGKAPAMLLGARGVAFGKACKIPYITDGLIGLWDYLENGSETYFVNLVDGSKKSMTSGESWIGNDGFSCYSASYKNIRLSDNRVDNALFYEAVFSVDKKVGGTGNGVFLKYGISYSVCANTQAGNSMLFGRFNKSTSKLEYGRVSVEYTNFLNKFATCSCGVVDKLLYHNSSVQSVLNYYYTTASSLQGLYPQILCEGGTVKFKNFRIYNRVLTSQEVSSNYLIDKARFGLP